MRIRAVASYSLCSLMGKLSYLAHRCLLESLVACDLLSTECKSAKCIAYVDRCRRVNVNSLGTTRPDGKQDGWKAKRAAYTPWAMKN